MSQEPRTPSGSAVGKTSQKKPQSPTTERISTSLDSILTALAALQKRVLALEARQHVHELIICAHHDETTITIEPGGEQWKIAEVLGQDPDDLLRLLGQ